MKNKINVFRKATIVRLGVVATVFITGCEEHQLPEAGSIKDTTPPQADFSYVADPADFRTINFTNLSTEAIKFEWDFGGGNTSTEQDPSFTFDGEGTYPVTLTATDGLGVSNSLTQEVVVEKGPLQPIIREPSFEDNDVGAEDCGTGLDGRDCWRNNDLGGVIQITSSPVRTGSQGAKLTGETGDQRIGYQEIVVEAETNYDVNFFYTMLSSPVGYITVDILDASGGTLTSHADAQEVVLGSVTVNNQEDPDTYEPGKVSFNSGTSTLVAIYFYNGGSVEARLEDFSIDIAPPGSIPPSASFSFMQSASNFLEYSFTNNSKNATEYTWDFGDGNTSTDVNPTHVYASASVYTVSLTAKNAAGKTATFSTQIDIQDPVTADFTFVVDGTDYQTYHFTDASDNAVSLLWDFGDGDLSTKQNPSHTYEADGIYDVTLTATSSTGLEDVATAQITVAQGFVPVILEAGFESNSLPDGTGDGRDSWRVSGGDRPAGMGGVIQITSSPVKTGSQAAKFPDDNTRAAYQEITVEANTDYTVTFWYTMKDSPAGSLTVAILDGPVSDPANVAGATIASITVNDQSDPNTYIEESVSFNSGSSTTIVIYITNTDVEARVDDVSIQ